MCDRDIVILRGVRQLPLPTVAKHFGKGPGTAAVRFHCALKRLRRKLPQLGVEGHGSSRFMTAQGLFAAVYGQPFCLR